MIRSPFDPAPFSASPLIIHTRLRYPSEYVWPLSIHEGREGSGNEGTGFGQEGAAPDHRSVMGMSGQWEGIHRLDATVDKLRKWERM
jgi:hypothetical protein